MAKKVELEQFILRKPQDGQVRQAIRTLLDRGVMSMDNLNYLIEYWYDNVENCLERFDNFEVFVTESGWQVARNKKR